MSEPYQQLEREFADYIGTRYAVSVSSGTAALHLSLVALGIGPGDEVIVPDFTMAATAFAVSYTGATPVFVDCDDTLNIDPFLLEKAITKKTKAIFVTHIYGVPADMHRIIGIAGEIPIIEDACEAHGAHIYSKRVGAWGTLGCFSFYRNKIVSAEEGGIITTNSKELHDKMQDLKSMAFGEKHDYYHAEIGFNYRMPNAEAKLALQSLHEIEAELHWRRKFADGMDYYQPEGSVPWVIPHIYETAEKAELARKLVKLADVGGTRPFFKPMSSLPMYEKCKVFTNSKAKDFSERGIYFIIPKRSEPTKSTWKNLLGKKS